MPRQRPQQARSGTLKWRLANGTTAEPWPVLELRSLPPEAQNTPIGRKKVEDHVILAWPWLSYRPYRGILADVVYMDCGLSKESRSVGVYELIEYLKP